MNNNIEYALPDKEFQMPSAFSTLKLRNDVSFDSEQWNFKNPSLWIQLLPVWNVVFVGLVLLGLYVTGLLDNIVILPVVTLALVLLQIASLWSKDRLTNRAALRTRTYRANMVSHLEPLIAEQGIHFNLQDKTDMCYENLHLLRVKDDRGFEYLANFTNSPDGSQILMHMRLNNSAARVRALLSGQASKNDTLLADYEASNGRFKSEELKDAFQAGAKAAKEKPQKAL